MKGILILLAIGLAASEKLDRTYLPPPGATFAGGSDGALQAPLELPKVTNLAEVLIADNGLPTLGDPRIEIGINRGQPDLSIGTTAKPSYTYYGNKIPTTTTSYAFAQTTTLAPFETYETTLQPINPNTGLPAQFSNGKFGYPSSGSPNFPGSQNLQGFLQTQRLDGPTFVNNIQPGSTDDDKSVRPSNGQINNQPAKYQSSISTSDIQNTGLVSPSQQSPGFAEYLSGLNILQQGPASSLSSTIAPQSTSNYSQGTSTLPPSQYSSNSKEQSPVTQMSNVMFPIQRNEAQNLGQYNQPLFIQNQYQQAGPVQQYSGTQVAKSTAEDSMNTYELGPIASTVTSPEYYNQPGLSSTTPLPSYSSTASLSIVKARPERPQAEADRKAVIVNYENNRTPNGYSYSYDTSNGIHADETGVVNDGTKAKGSYSYVGDDGKVYSITYTADENGFQPRGDHLPTPPPLPEAIQKVIEQAARDEAAGISDDGSYDEAKYGDKLYSGPKDYYTTYNQDSNDNNQYIGPLQGNRRKPESVLKISDIPNEQRENTDQFDNNNNLMDGYKAQPIAKIQSGGLTNDRIEGNRDSSDDTGRHPIAGLRDINVNKGNTIGTSDYSTPQEVSTTNFDDSPRDSQNVVNKKESRRPGLSSQEDKSQASEEPFIQRETYDEFGNKILTKPGVNKGQIIDRPLDQMTISTPIGNEKLNDNNSGYQYNVPQTKFPIRFRNEEGFKKPVHFGISTEVTTAPNVYNRDDTTRLSSFTKKPFRTPDITSPTTEGAYSVYNDEDDQTNGPNGYRKSSTRIPVEVTSHPYQATKTPSRVNAPINQRLHITQGIPESRTTDYFFTSTTPMPLQSSRFRTTQQKPTSPRYQQRPSSTVATSSRRKVTRPGPQTASTVNPGYNFQTIGPQSEYSTTNLVPGSSPDSISFGSRLPSNVKGITTQNYPSYRPASMTIRPEISFGSVPTTPISSVPQNLPSSYQSGYQYGPPESRLSYPGKNLLPSSELRPGLTSLIPSGQGMYSQMPPGSVYQYGPVTKYSGTSVSSPIPSRFGSTFQVPSEISSGFPTTTSSRTESGSPGSSSQSYSSSTYRPGFDIAQGSFDQPAITVDNFGRPIYPEQEYSGYATQTSGVPSNQAGKAEDAQVSIGGQTFDGSSGNVPLGESVSNDFPSTSSRNYETTDRVIGEDFSGPKQPQRFDPETGYLY